MTHVESCFQLILTLSLLIWSNSFHVIFSFHEIFVTLGHLVLSACTCVRAAQLYNVKDRRDHRVNRGFEKEMKNHRGNGIFPADMKWRMFPAKTKYYPRNKIFPAEIKYSPRKRNVAIFLRKYSPRQKILPAAQNIFPATKDITRGPENIPRGKKYSPRPRKYSPRPRKYSPRQKKFFSMSLPGFRNLSPNEYRFYSWDGSITWGMEILLAVNSITRGIELLLMGCIYYSRDEHITRGNKILLADK